MYAKSLVCNMSSSTYIYVEKLDNTPMELREIEFVERKGLGHPDFIADSIAEAVSLGLSKEYLRRYGIILHHNVDKVLVVGGQANPVFGGGEVIKPIYVIVSGRVTTEVEREGRTELIPVGKIILEESKNWLKKNFRYLNPEIHTIIDYKIGKGSADLKRLVESGGRYPLANDTSIGVSYAPLTKTEKLVLELERFLNSRDFKKMYPAVGEDIKIMALRRKDSLKITVAAAMISKLVRDLDEYFSIKQEVKDRIYDYVVKMCSDFNIEIDINTADKRDDPKSIYLTVTGTSAEHGDDGMTGRGNRVNGLITPMRPMSLEATAGKNPVSHVGKIYNVLAKIVANKIYEETGVCEVYVEILSQIGKPINKPLIANISIIPSNNSSFNSVKYEAENIMQEWLDNIHRITEMILNREISIF